MEFLPLINFYFTVAFFVLIVNAVLAGFNGARVTVDDIVQSSLWPISLASLLGTLVRIGYESYKQEAQKAPKKKDTK
jgi:hypothetical protein